MRLQLTSGAVIASRCRIQTEERQHINCESDYLFDFAKFLRIILSAG
jgi:hypothetical protein